MNNENKDKQQDWSAALASVCRLNTTITMVSEQLAGKKPFDSLFSDIFQDILFKKPTNK